MSYELPTYLILPLTGLNFKKFGRFTRTAWNLRATKINLTSRCIHCEVFDINLLPNNVLSNENFIKIIKPNIIVLNIPTTITKTLRAFKRGQYSTFPNSIKEWLRLHSGLPDSSDYIQSLYKSDKVRKKLESELKVSIPEGAELLEAPKESWFIVEQEERAV